MPQYDHLKCIQILNQQLFQNLYNNCKSSPTHHLEQNRKIVMASGKFVLPSQFFLDPAANKSRKQIDQTY